VIVHEKVDDWSQPVGNAGSRQACGVIGVAKP
jgi:Cu/Zn superoxide dismutase